MAKGIQLSEVEAAEQWRLAQEHMTEYNDEHDDTFMMARQLPGGNVVIEIHKR